MNNPITTVNLTLPPPIRDILKARFDQKDLKALFGAANLTTINAYSVIERLNDAFGIGGWRVEFDIIHQTMEEVVVFGRMFITIDGKEVRLSDTAGNMENRKIKSSGKWNHSLGDLIKGAGTNLIGKSASIIEVGIDVYKGLQNHNTPAPKKPTVKAIKEKTYTIHADKWDRVKSSITSIKDNLVTITNIDKNSDKKTYKAVLTPDQLEEYKTLNK